jgi:hypothetical protein
MRSLKRDSPEHLVGFPEANPVRHLAIDEQSANHADAILLCLCSSGLMCRTVLNDTLGEEVSQGFVGTGGEQGTRWFL